MGARVRNGVRLVGHTLCYALMLQISNGKISIRTLDAVSGGKGEHLARILYNSSIVKILLRNLSSVVSIMTRLVWQRQLLGTELAPVQRVHGNSQQKV